MKDEASKRDPPTSGGPGSLHVLVVDAHKTVAEALAQVVGTLPLVDVAATTSSASQAVELARKLSPDVAIVDLALSPSCALISGLLAIAPDTRIIVMGERDHTGSVIKALETGAVGALYKEMSLEELERALAASSHTTPVMPEEAAGLLLNSYLDAVHDKRMRDLATVEALAAAVEIRDVATGHHLSRVTNLATRCMERLEPQLAKNEEVFYGFMLHDIGKIGVPDAILNKPAALDAEEWNIMRRHPEMGVKIVSPVGFSETTTDIILCHHERCDGTGYPNGLERDEIPLTARAFAVADAYDAMTSDRPYRPAMPRREAVAILRSTAGKVHDPALVDLLIDITD